MPSKKKSNSKQRPQANSRDSLLRRSSVDNTSSPVADSETESKEKTTLLVNEVSSKKWRNMGIRTFTTLLMIGAFLFVLASGYIWAIVAVMAISIAVYREVIQIAQIPAKEKSVRWFKTMSW